MPTPKSNKPKQKLSGKKHQNKKELIIELLPIIKSFILWIVLVVIVAWDYTNNQWFSLFFIEFTTYLTYGFSKLLFIPVEILGEGNSTVAALEVYFNQISINGYSMLIELECTAYHAYIALLTLVIFSTWKLKLKLIVGGILFTVLSLVNSIRIILLGIIGNHFPNIFDMIHDYIWNILLVIIIWGLWELANRKLKTKQ